MIMYHVCSVLCWACSGSNSMCAACILLCCHHCSMQTRLCPPALEHAPAANPCALHEYRVALRFAARLSMSVRTAAPTCAILSSMFVLGTDFSGLCAPSHALKQLQVDHRYAFACDIEPACRKVLAFCHNPRVIYGDIRSRDSSATPGCDLYVSGFPCQAFSSLGLGLGMHDLRGRGLLVACSLDYIRTRQPTACILENVPAILATKHRQLHDLVTTSLASMGYIVGESVLNVADFGLPQRRNRWFLLAIRQDRIRTPATDLQHLFPAPVGYCIALDKIVKPLPPSQFAAYPTGHTKGARLWRSNIKKAYEQVAATTGANPFLVPVVVDMKSSSHFSSHLVGKAPCLTCSRCASMGYWCSVKGGALNCTEMAQLQGIFEPLDCEAAGISFSQYGAMIGNAMPVNLLVCILPEFLYAATLVSKAACDSMKRRAF